MCRSLDRLQEAVEAGVRGGFERPDSNAEN